MILNKCYAMNQKDNTKIIYNNFQLGLINTPKDTIIYDMQIIEYSIQSLNELFKILPSSTLGELDQLWIRIKNNKNTIKNIEDIYYIKIILCQLQKIFHIIENKENLNNNNSINQQHIDGVHKIMCIIIFISYNAIKDISINKYKIASFVNKLLRYKFKLENQKEISLNNFLLLFYDLANLSTQNVILLNKLLPLVFRSNNKEFHLNRLNDAILNSSYKDINEFQSMIAIIKQQNTIQNKIKLIDNLRWQLLNNNPSKTFEELCNPEIYNEIQYIIQFNKNYKIPQITIKLDNNNNNQDLLKENNSNIEIENENLLIHEKQDLEIEEYKINKKVKKENSGIIINKAIGDIELTVDINNIETFNIDKLLPILDKKLNILISTHNPLYRSSIYSGIINILQIIDSHYSYSNNYILQDQFNKIKLKIKDADQNIEEIKNLNKIIDFVHGFYIDFQTNSIKNYVFKKDLFRSHLLSNQLIDKIVLSLKSIKNIKTFVDILSIQNIVLENIAQLSYINSDKSLKEIFELNNHPELIQQVSAIMTCDDIYFLTDQNQPNDLIQQKSIFFHNKEVR